MKYGEEKRQIAALERLERYISNTKELIELCKQGKLPEEYKFDGKVVANGKESTMRFLEDKLKKAQVTRENLQRKLGTSVRD